MLIDDTLSQEVSLSMVWLKMLPLDSSFAATRQARSMQAAHVRHFYDPRRRVGKAVAQVLGGHDKVAWDIYLFFDHRADWGDLPPFPIRWAHQLSPSSWASPEHYRTGNGLVEELTRARRELIKPPTSAFPPVR